MSNHRILSLDVFRGITIALMILVNSQSIQAMYAILDHAQWNGCTLADLVFPAFLFIVGVTTVISLNRHIALEGKVDFNIYQGILKRSILLFALGLLLNAFPLHFDFATLRVYGILQRIALCYFVCSLLYLNTSVKTQVLIFLGILVGYWYLITQVPVPGIGGNSLARVNNWGIYIDKLLLPEANFYKNLDPEGLLSTVPAIATTLSGVFIGQLLLTKIDKLKKCFFMSIMALLFILSGWFWSLDIPLNKSLWTSSFVLWTSGISLALFAICFYLIDLLGYKKWAIPFKILGMNALFIFILHVFLLKIQFNLKFPAADGSIENVKVLITNYLFAGFSPENASLMYSFIFLLLNFLVALLLYKRKIFFKL